MNPKHKTQIDSFTKDAPMIDLIKFVQHRNEDAVINNADDFKDFQYLATMFDSEILVKKDDVYYLVAEDFNFNKDSANTIDLRISNNVEEDETNNYSLPVDDEENEIEEMTDLTIAECIILAFEEKLYPEANAGLIYTAEEAEEYNLI
jgi:hypothetical protein